MREATKIRYRGIRDEVLMGKPVGRSMIKFGLSPATAHNPWKNLFNKETWKEVMAEVDDGVVIRRFWEILHTNDNRAALEAGKELLKLKDRYPAGKLKVTEMNEELEKLQND